MKQTYEMDMCTGPVFKKLVIFAIPLMISGILQLLFNAVDIIVVGQFSGNQDLAAVGSTSSIINLNTKMFIGLSVGTNVMVAKYFGGKEEQCVRETVHTAILTALIAGIMLVFVGLLAARPMLIWMGTPEDVLAGAVLYMQLYFLGMPFFMLYNFGAAVLRAIGDTKRPLYYLMISGAVNVILNMIFVIFFQLGVAGVAIATVISQGISAVCVMRCLCTTDGSYRVERSALRIYKHRLVEMLQIGLPAGLQGILITFSNVLIQSSINSFGSIAMAGCTAASNIESFLHAAVNAVTQTCLSFISQNMGAKQYQRVKTILWECILLAVLLGTGLGALVYALKVPLLHIYSPDLAVVAMGIEKLKVICLPYALFGLMDLLPGALRGMGYSLQPTLITLAGTCLFRIAWVLFAFPEYHTLYSLYISYPISWAVTALVQGLFFVVVRKSVFKTS